MFKLSTIYKYSDTLVVYQGEQAGLYVFTGVLNPAQTFSLVPSEAENVQDIPDAEKPKVPKANTLLPSPTKV